MTIRQGSIRTPQHTRETVYIAETLRAKALPDVNVVEVLMWDSVVIQVKGVTRVLVEPVTHDGYWCVSLLRAEGLMASKRLCYSLDGVVDQVESFVRKALF